MTATQNNTQRDRPARNNTQKHKPKQNNTQSQKPKCGARKRQGEGNCQRPAGWGTSHPGIGACKLHGGSTQNAAKHAQVVQARRDVDAWGGRTDVAPAEALLQLVQAKAAEVAYWEWRVAELADDARAGLLLSKRESGLGAQGPVDVDTHTAGPHVFVVLLHKAQDQLAAYAAAAVRVGVDKALVELAALQAAWLVPLLLEAVAAGRADIAADGRDVVRALLEQGAPA